LPRRHQRATRLTTVKPRFYAKKVDPSIIALAFKRQFDSMKEQLQLQLEDYAGLEDKLRTELEAQGIIGDEQEIYVHIGFHTYSRCTRFTDLTLENEFDRLEAEYLKRGLEYEIISKVERIVREYAKIPVVIGITELEIEWTLADFAISWTGI